MISTWFAYNLKSNRLNGIVWHAGKYMLAHFLAYKINTSIKDTDAVSLALSIRHKIILPASLKLIN